MHNQTFCVTGNIKDQPCCIVLGSGALNEGFAPGLRAWVLITAPLGEIHDPTLWIERSAARLLKFLRC